MIRKVLEGTFPAVGRQIIFYENEKLHILSFSLEEWLKKTSTFRLIPKGNKHCLYLHVLVLPKHCSKMQMSAVARVCILLYFALLKVLNHEQQSLSDLFSLG